MGKRCERNLLGLSEGAIAQCKKDAESRGGKAPYCIVITNTTQQPILANLENRQLRERVYNASIHRTDGTGEYNTFPVIVEITKLRAEKAQLMGYKNYASYALANVMAKNTDNVYAFLNQLIKEYQPKAVAETKDIEAYARKHKVQTLICNLTTVSIILQKWRKNTSILPMMKWNRTLI